MIKKSRRAVIIMILLSSLVLSGCWDQKIFENIGFILQIGLETSPDGQLLYSVTLPVVSKDIKEKVEILSASGNLLRDCREKIRNASGRLVEGGKCQHLIFSKELAEKGIDHYMEVFLRNSENPLLANVLVVDGSPNEMFTLGKSFQDKPRIALYVTDLLENARQGSLAKEMRIYEFIIKKESRTIDPIAPIIMYDDKDLEVKGSALFNIGKMVGEINTTQTGLLLMLMGEKIHFGYTFQGDKRSKEADGIKKGAALLIKGYKKKVDLDISNGSPRITIQLYIKASLEEKAQGYEIDNADDKKAFEKAISQSLNQDYAELIKYLQEVGSDPIGLGELVRVQKNEYYKSINWKEAYADADITVKAKLNIEYYGAVN